MASSASVEPGATCTVCATVITGLESVAVIECQEKLNCKASKERGRVYFEIPVELVEKTKDLQSVEKLFIVVQRFTEFGITRKDEGDILRKFYDLVEKLDWELPLSVWKSFTGYLGPLKITEEQKVMSQSDVINTSRDLPTGGKDRPSFRVTCTRTGNNHGFSSMEAAAHLGGAINDLFLWTVDLSNADIEVILNVVDDRVVVSIALTRETQGLRNIEHFGPTTLKSSLAYCLLKLAEIKPGDVVCDPMCGGGSIPIEALLNWPLSVHLCGDNHELAPTRTQANRQAIAAKLKRCLPLEIYQWDVRSLPLKSNSIDVMVTDLPFGKKSGSKYNNWFLYPKVLEEMARVCPPCKGRAVILTHDTRVLSKTLKCQQWWKVKLTLWINMGGLKSGVYVLTRSQKCFDIPT